MKFLVYERERIHQTTTFGVLRHTKERRKEGQ